MSNERHFTDEPAAAYYRMSHDKQERSVGEQREAVRTYAAKHGYRIVREYTDEGISGDATEKRLQFRQMLQDAAERGNFRVVLCWDQDRFGRFDPLEAGYWVKPLRDAGVRLETVAQGRIDWNDFAGRIVYAVQQEGKHAFLRDLSRNVLRGKLAAAARGTWNGGRPPYGYRVEGQRLVPADPAEVEAVRWLFATYAAGRMSLRALTNDLNARGVPGPKGGPWTRTSVRRTLTCPQYLGSLVWNQTHKGKYHGVAGGEIVPDRRVPRGEVRNGPGDRVLSPEPHEPLIDRDTWEAVQRQLAARRQRTTPHPGGGDFLLTNLIHCGHCGGRMHGNVCRKRARGLTFAYRRYVCSGYHSKGRAVCQFRAVLEEPLAACLDRLIRRDFLNPENLQKLREEIDRKLEARRGGDRAAERRLEAKVAELGRQIDQGNANLALLPADLIAGVVATVRGWKEERDRLQAELAALRAGREPAAADRRRAEAALAELTTLEERVREADPRRVAEVFRQMVERVDCWFERVPWGRRFRHRLTRGVVRLRQDRALCRLGTPVRTSVPSESRTFHSVRCG
jgi:DNA invertase Pin-like site-specific DNA recombinase